MSRVRVFFEQRLVGMVDVDKNGPGFTYDRDWISLKGAFPVSTTMPLTAKRVGPDTFFPWAANLLPENEQLRTLGQLLGMAREDVIGLLSAIGGDTAGALSIGQPGRTGSVQWRPIAKPEDLESIIEELPNKPFLVGDDGVSMSLAGAQTKLAVALDEAGRVCIPMNGSPSTHILKPDTQRLFGGVQNEAFCLTLTRRVGIPTPTLKDMFEVTRRHMPPTEIVRLLDMVVVNVLVCNTDAHAKNYSIMIRASAPSLAPMYDVMCGEVWENVTKNHAQKIAGEGRGGQLTGRHWQRFARDCGLNPKQVIDRVGAMARSVIAEAEASESEVAAMPAGGHPILSKTRQAVEIRARAILAQLRELEGAPVAAADDNDCSGRAEEDAEVAPWSLGVPTAPANVGS